jgi:hypothetical protein
VKTYTLLFFIVFEALSTLCKAQLYVGPTVGGQVTWLQFDDASAKGRYNIKPYVGFNAGLNISFRVRKRFFLHTSILYSQKGKDITGKDDALLKNKVRYNYIEIPILYTVEYKRATKTGKQFKWYFGAGPNVSYWLNGKGTFYNSELEESFSPPRKYSVAFGKGPEDINENELSVLSPNRLQLGLNLSAGLVFEPMEGKEFMLTFRYELGHSFMSRSDDGYFKEIVAYTDDLQTRYSGIRVSIAYLIDLKPEQRKKGKSTINKNRMK